MGQLTKNYFISIILGLFLFIFSTVVFSVQDIQWTDPSHLLNKHRFSIMGKYIYVKHTVLGVDSQWASDLYQAHLYAINKCSGDGHQIDVDGKMVLCKHKNSIRDYKTSFYQLIHSMQAEGFDALKSIVFRGPHTILDGEHRVACSLWFNLLVPCKDLNISDWMHSYSPEYFITQKLSEKYLDAMALEYAKLKKSSYIVSLFSKARTKDSQVRATLNRYGSIVYEKEVVLCNEGPFNLMKLFYVGENWMGTWDNGFPGARGKGSSCFDLREKQFPIRVFLWECEGSLEMVRECKKNIRALFNLHNDSVHINDTHEEAVRYAQAYFNENSIHFLNHAKPKKFIRFLSLIEQYARWLQDNNIEPDCLCIDGSAVLSAYGIRECNDLDVLHHGYEEEMGTIPHKLIGSHNDEMCYHAFKKDEIIFNPQHHFYCYGLKFATLNVIKKMKLKRNEPKDKRDTLEIIKYE